MAYSQMGTVPWEWGAETKKSSFICIALKHPSGGSSKQLAHVLIGG